MDFCVHFPEHRRVQLTKCTLHLMTNHLLDFIFWIPALVTKNPVIGQVPKIIRKIKQVKPVIKSCRTWKWIHLTVKMKLFIKIVIFITETQTCKLVGTEPMLTQIFQKIQHRQIYSLGQINNHFPHLGNQLEHLKNLTIFR